MDTIRVLIDNWPETNHIAEYFTIAIALIALGGSLYSVYLTRKSFIAAHRPYVWASNYGVIDHDSRIMIPVPSKVGFRVKNAPARIIHQEVRISLADQALLTHPCDNAVRFPDERSEWAFEVGKDDFQNIMNRSNEEKARLERSIRLDYAALSGGKKYYYQLRQKFVPGDNQWRDVNEEAS